MDIVKEVLYVLIEVALKYLKLILIYAIIILIQQQLVPNNVFNIITTTEFVKHIVKIALILFLNNFQHINYSFVLQ